MNKFNPLEALRAVRKDKSLSTAERGWMTTMVLATDNETGRVRRSLELLADEANCSYKSATRYIARPQVAKYFIKEKVNARRVNYTWRALGDILSYSNDEVFTASAAPVGHSGSTRSQVVSADRQVVPQVGQGDSPSTHSSTLSSTFSSTKEVPADADPSLSPIRGAPFFPLRQPFAPGLATSGCGGGQEVLQQLNAPDSPQGDFKARVESAVTHQHGRDAVPIMRFWEDLQAQGMPAEATDAAQALHVLWVADEW